jgi:hypothetical protein
MEYSDQIYKGTNKYNFNDIVYFMHHNEIEKGRITKIEMLPYGFMYTINGIEVTEGLLYMSKEALIEHLIRFVD